MPVEDFLHYVNAVDSLPQQMLKKLYSGDFTSSLQGISKVSGPHKFSSGYMYKKVRKSTSVHCFADFL